VDAALGALYSRRMRPTRIKGAEPKPLGAPPDWKPEVHGSCGALFIRRDKHDGVDFMTSAWEVESKEAALMFAGAAITLGVSGSAHPVVQLVVGQLPDEFDPVVLARRVTSPSGEPFVKVEMLFAHGTGKRAYCTSPMPGTFAQALVDGVKLCEDLARNEGWIT